jgi:hypothetical protein
VLRPGNAPGSAGAIGILRRLIGRVKKAFPRARIRVRLDGASRPRKFWIFRIANRNWNTSST